MRQIKHSMYWMVQYCWREQDTFFCALHRIICHKKNLSNVTSSFRRVTLFNSADSYIFQRIFWFAHCTDEDQKSETMVYSWNNQNSDKLTWKMLQVTLWSRRDYHNSLQVLAIDEDIYDIRHSFCQELIGYVFQINRIV